MKLINVALSFGAIAVTYKVAESMGFVGGSLYLIDKYKGNDKAAFAQKVRAVSGRLAIKPNWLMAVMHFETAGSLSPQEINPISGATGLIQFMPSTAQSLGTSTGALYQMSALQQLDFVEKYLRPYTGKMDSFINTYLAVFYPVAMNWSLDKQFPSYVAAVNTIFVENGILTKRTIQNELKSRYPNLFTTPSIPFIGAISTNTLIKSQTDWFEPYLEKGFIDSRGKFDH